LIENIRGNLIPDSKESSTRTNSRFHHIFEKDEVDGEGTEALTEPLRRNTSNSLLYSPGSSVKGDRAHMQSSSPKKSDK